MINKHKLFVWNWNNVSMINLDEKLIKSNFKRLSLTLDDSDRSAFIKDIRTGSDPNKIVIIVQ